jgi:hypothetical protein
MRPKTHGSTAVDVLSPSSAPVRAGLMWGAGAARVAPVWGQSPQGDKIILTSSTPHPYTGAPLGRDEAFEQA